MPGDPDWAGRGFSGPDFSESAECPSCGHHAEPEQDGDVLYWACDCGFEFGHARVTQPEESCAAGIPLAHLATLQGGPLTPGQEAALDLGPEVTFQWPHIDKGVTFLGDIGQRCTHRMDDPAHPSHGDDWPGGELDVEPGA